MGGRADSERERIRAALIELVDERGYRETTLEAVLERAGLAEDSFARHYPDLDACFTEIWLDYREIIFAATRNGFASGEGWREGMRAAAWRYCRFLEEDRARTRFFLVEFNFAGEAVRASRDLAMREYAELIDQGNGDRPDRDRVPLAHAEAIIGAIWEATVTRSLHDELHTLPEAIPEAMFLTVFPYLGAEAAQDELQRGPADLERYRRGEI